MDDELEAAESLSRDDLLAKLANGVSVRLLGAEDTLHLLFARALAELIRKCEIEAQRRRRRAQVMANARRLTTLNSNPQVKVETYADRKRRLARESA